MLEGKAGIFLSPYANDDRNSLSNNTASSDSLTILEYQKWYTAHNLPHDDDMPKDQQDTSLSAEYQTLDTCEDEGQETNLEVITAKRRTKSLVDECALYGEDQHTLMAECRACNIRLKPQVTEGVILTCFECHSMPVDQTCKLGVHDKENPKYRVSASFFEVLVQNTTDTYESQEEDEQQNEAF